MALLREVKYLNQREPNSDQPIPESTAAVFSQNATYRKYLQNLDVTVALYNKVKETILDVEEPLIEGQLQIIDTQLERAISELNWTSEGTAELTNEWTEKNRLGRASVTEQGIINCNGG